MKLFFALIIALTLFIDAKGYGYKTLKPLKSFKASDFRLKKGVVYLEIREYFRHIDEKKFNYYKYDVTLRAGRSPLRSYSKNAVKHFKNSKPLITKHTNIRLRGGCIMAGCWSSKSNAFIIDSKGKQWRMDEIADIINMLGKIDTPAELKLVLWLKNKHRVLSGENFIDRYKEVANGYKVISEYDNSVNNYGECGHFTYSFFVDRKGRILNKRLIKKSESKNGCMAMD